MTTPRSLGKILAPLSMQTHTSWMMLGFALVLAACTIHSTDTTNGDTSNGSTNGTAEQPGEGKSSTESPAPAEAADSVPGKLAGRTWTWVTSAGAHALTFASDGKYTSDVLLNGHPGESCGTEYFTQYAGTASFKEGSLTLRAPQGKRTKSDSCSNKTLSEEVIEGQEQRYGWRLADEGTGEEALVLSDDEGIERKYYPD